MTVPTSVQQSETAVVSSLSPTRNKPAVLQVVGIDNRNPTAFTTADFNEFAANRKRTTRLRLKSLILFTQRPGLISTANRCYIKTYFCGESTRTFGSRLGLVGGETAGALAGESKTLEIHSRCSQQSIKRSQRGSQSKANPTQ